MTIQTVGNALMITMLVGVTLFFIYILVKAILYDFAPEKVNNWIKYRVEKFKKYNPDTSNTDGEYITINRQEYENLLDRFEYMETNTLERLRVLARDQNSHTERIAAIARLLDTSSSHRTQMETIMNDIQMSKNNETRLQENQNILDKNQRDLEGNQKELEEKLALFMSM